MTMVAIASLLGARKPLQTSILEKTKSIRKKSLTPLSPKSAYHAKNFNDINYMK